MLISLEQQVSKILGICAIGSWFLCANCFDEWRASPDLCCLISIPLFLIFFYEHIIFQITGSYFGLYVQWAVLTCVMQFHDQLEINTPNDYQPCCISLFVFAILEQMEGCLHFGFDMNRVLFFLGQGRSFILSCHLNMQPIFLLPCSN